MCVDNIILYKKNYVILVKPHAFTMKNHKVNLAFAKRF